MPEDANVIFRRSIGEEDVDGRLFIQLETTNQATLFSKIQPQSVYIATAFSMASVIVTVSFIDGDGIYSNLIKLDHDEVFWMTFGDTFETASRIPMKISKIEQENTKLGVAEDILFTITFVHETWDGMLNIRYNRGWADCKVSSVMEEVLLDAGFGSVEVQPSKKIFETLIQPWWTNIQFIKWMQKNALAENFEDHFEFGYRLDGKIFFKSVSEIINENLDSIENGDIPTIILAADLTNAGDRVEEVAGNNGVQSTFYGYTVADQYINCVINGGGGLNATYFDFDTGKIVTESVKQSKMDFLQLGDWLNIKTEHENTNYPFFGGTDKNTADSAKAHVSGISLASSPMTMMMQANTKLNIGDLVEVLVPLNPETIIQPFSILNSGFYIVSLVEHRIDMVNNGAVTKVGISRRGFDDKNIKGYASTPKGKIFSTRDMNNV